MILIILSPWSTLERCYITELPSSPSHSMQTNWQNYSNQFCFIVAPLNLVQGPRSMISKFCYFSDLTTARHLKHTRSYQMAGHGATIIYFSTDRDVIRQIRKLRPFMYTLLLRRRRSIVFWQLGYKYIRGYIYRCIKSVIHVSWIYW